MPPSQAVNEVSLAPSTPVPLSSPCQEAAAISPPPSPPCQNTAPISVSNLEHVVQVSAQNPKVGKKRENSILHDISFAEELDNVLFSGTPVSSSCSFDHDGGHTFITGKKMISPPGEDNLVKGTAPLEDEEMEDVLVGLKPEDFSFGLNSSSLEEDNEGKFDTSFRPGDGGEDCRVGCDLLCGTPPEKECANLNSIPESPINNPFVSSPSSPLSPPPTTYVDQLEYPVKTFYGLPLSVQNCLEEHRGIKKLYGTKLLLTF